MRDQVLFDLLRRKRRLYKRVFDTVDGRAVLADLATWCCGMSTTHTPGDPVTTGVLEGRRQVYLRMREGVDLSDADIARHSEVVEQYEET